MIKLTRPDGERIEVNPDSISEMEPALAGVFAPGAKTVIRVDGSDHAVRETMEQIDALRGPK